MRKYKVMHNQYMGYAAAMWNDYGHFWQQCSLWYTSLNYLNRYWSTKNGIKLSPHGIVEC